MTILIALQTKEGIVIGCDSTSTMRINGEIAHLFTSAQKIFPLGPANDAEPFKPGEFAGILATSGDAAFGPMSWRSLANAFSLDLLASQLSSTSDTATALLNFTQRRWEEMQASSLVPTDMPFPSATLNLAVVLPGGYEAQGARVEIATGKVEHFRVGALKISGEFEVISRILQGYDQRLLEALSANGIDAELFTKLAAPFLVIPQLPHLPLREAIDFVHYLVYSAIKLAHYQQGPAATIGGSPEIAILTPDRGFCWIAHKSVTDAIRDPIG